MKTYNHEGFIETAISSILSQVCDYSFEIVVFDDCSTDNTAAICARLAESAGGRMRFVRQPVNVGRDRNSRAALAECRGRFIALLEGDDYWCSNEKLQRALDVLSGDPAIQMVCHAVSSLDEATGIVGTARGFGYLSEEDPVEREWRVLEWPRLGPATCSLVFRSEIRDELLSARFKDGPIFDMTILHLAAERGRIHYLPAIMGVYRKHPGGVWSGASRVAHSLQTLGSVINLLELKVYREDDVRSWLMALFDYNVIRVAECFSDQSRFLAKLEEMSSGCVDRFSPNPWVLRKACASIVERNGALDSIRASTSFRFGSLVIGFGARLANLVRLKR